jgi:hypothetical protein
MGPWSARQLAALGAVAATVLFVVGFGLYGSPPKFDANAAKIAVYFHSHHKKALVATVLVEIGVAIMIGVIAQLAVLLRDAGQRGHGAVVGIAGAASLSILAVAAGIYGGLAQIATFGHESIVDGPLYRLVQFIVVGWFWITLVMVIAVALAAWNGAFPRLVAGANGLVAVLIVLGGISVKGTGVLAAGTGAFSLIGTIAFFAWVLHLAALLWDKPKPAAAAPMTTPA